MLPPPDPSVESSGRARLADMASDTGSANVRLRLPVFIFRGAENVRVCGSGGGGKSQVSNGSDSSSDTRPFTHNASSAPTHTGRCLRDSLS